MNELDFLREAANGMLVRDHTQPDFAEAQKLRDTLGDRGYLKLGNSVSGGSHEGELQLVVFGLTEAGENLFAEVVGKQRE